MLKATFWILITVILTSISGVCLGFVYCYDKLGQVWFWIFLGSYLSLLITLGGLVTAIAIKLNKVLQEIKKLSLKDIIKIALKLFKNKK